MSAVRLAWALAEKVARPGCPVCAVLRDDERRFWDGFLYEGFQDPGASRQLQGSAGYCLRHLEQLRERHDLFASATMAIAAVAGARALLEDASTARRRRWRRAARRRPSECPVCVRLAGTQLDALGELTARLADTPELCTAYAASDGVCVDHLLVQEEVARDERVTAPARRRLADYAVVLERVRSSFDYRHDAATAQEAEVWARAFRIIRDEPGAIRMGGRPPAPPGQTMEPDVTATQLEKERA